MGDISDSVLGSIWSDRPGQLRADGNQRVHEILGSHHVRELLYHQHHCPAESPDRHDESLVPTNKCQLGKILKNCQSYFEYHCS